MNFGDFFHVFELVNSEKMCYAETSIELYKNVKSVKNLSKYYHKHEKSQH